jgi:predicted nucleotidyltransferase
MPNSGMIMPILGMKRGKAAKAATKEGLLDPIFTKTQQRVLGALFGRPDRSFYASELIRETGTGSGAAQRELARLERVGLIVSEPIGRQKHYRANAEAPLFPEVRSIIMKTIGLAEPLRAALKPMASAIHLAFVYGSVAKALDHASSDIDLFVVSDTLTYSDVFGALDRASGELGRKINPTIYTRAELSKRTREGNAFLTRVLDDTKIWLIGSDEDLAVEP